ncbi:unnamed protein product, partial [marine sediment metagenome]
MTVRDNRGIELKLRFVRKQNNKVSNLHIMKTNLYCPRCHTTKISEYEETFECTKCKDNKGFPLEFEKKVIGKIPD